MNIEIIPGYSHVQEIKSLFAEYTAMLIESDSRMREYLSMQNYAAELEHLEDKYGPPAGRLYIALCDGKAAGCIALRKIDEHSCEMKRLYVRPGFRGAKLGERLIEKIMSDAREIGYSYMLLDTLPFLQAAIHTYKKLGFYEIPCYNDNPIDGSIYLRYDF
ncbi:MAG: GNAT family N-acetyltransferase [Oscillospiraceae bacterium]|nr:GNAT family N-acetyltransferase [Oscillospiraceae bacterium]